VTVRTAQEDGTIRCHRVEQRLVSAGLRKQRKVPATPLQPGARRQRSSAARNRRDNRVNALVGRKVTAPALEPAANGMGVGVVEPGQHHLATKIAYRPRIGCGDHGIAAGCQNATITKGDGSRPAVGIIQGVNGCVDEHQVRRLSFLATCKAQSQCGESQRSGHGAGADSA